jgi:hypothetical protein
MLCLSFEVFQKVKKPLDMKYKTRDKFYHLFCHGFAGIIMIIAIVSDAPGLTMVDNCFIKGGSWVQILGIIPT